MSQCPELVAQLQNIKELQNKLNHEIEEFSDAKDNPQITRDEKLLKVQAVYQTRKEIADSYFFKEKTVAKFIAQLGSEYNYKTIPVVIDHITNKAENGLPFTKDEIGFIYKLNIPNHYFDYDNIWDERKDILSTRDLKADLAFYFGCQPNQISYAKEEALAGGIKYHYGNLSLRLKSTEGLILPQVILGQFIFGISSLDGFILPYEVRDNLIFDKLESANNLVLPKIVGGILNLNYLKTFENLRMPEKVGDDVYLNSLETADGLDLPEEIGGDIYLTSLESAKGLRFPKKMRGRIAFRHLTTIDGLILPAEVREVKVDNFDLSLRLQQKYPNLKIT
jgi:hypothetical protein